MFEEIFVLLYIVYWWKNWKFEDKEVKKNMKILILEIYKEQNLKIYSSNVKI